MKRVKRMREMDLCCKRNNQSFFLFLFFIAKQNQGWCDFISSLFIQSSICFIRFGWHVVSKEERYKTSYRRIKWWRREVKLSLPSIQALNLSYCLSFLCVVFFLSIHSPDCQSKIQHHLFSLILLLHYCLEVVVVARFVCVILSAEIPFHEQENVFTSSWLKCLLFFLRIQGSLRPFNCFSRRRLIISLEV